MRGAGSAAAGNLLVALAGGSSVRGAGSARFRRRQHPEPGCGACMGDQPMPA